MPHTLPPLPYGYTDLEPYYDEATLRLHHDKHHQAYVDGLNAAEQKLAAAREAKDKAAMPALERNVAFHGAGHLLHTVFWTNMKKNGGGTPSGDLSKQIDTDFGSFDGFMAQFRGASEGVQGSGWGVLAWSRAFNKLEVLGCHNHENSAWWSAVPLLVCDVWEHAYYLKYNNRRAEWVQKFTENLVNWDDVAERFAAARS